MPEFTAQSMHQPRKIALFGGTFDPIHAGHIHLAEVARSALELDEIRFLPCRISPHKTGLEPASATDRITMLKLATSALPWAVVDDFELQRDGPSFSFETAEAMAARFPEARLFWIMGGDQWASLPTWKHPQRLAKCVEFIVLSRGEPLAPHEDFRLHVVHGTHPASATEIRQAISQGTITHPWLMPSVAQWIASQNLYLR